ncbi:spore germination protein [Clostridium fungisolvens]|uniref:Spore germination protein A1 n=1 Tax=Clostridium fungisolvens TaxID=1604897 RepID=A0A6V8SCK1_9CLOT|nr:spore germination protein [Clostridium fungisolvens]GFP74426.1 Spore germination protein A1 [Clostridium fungisolvens]
MEKDIIEELKNNITGMLSRKLNIKEKEIYILYIPEITNRDSLSENIIKPLLQYSDIKSPTAELIMSSIIYIDDVLLEEDINKMTDYILKGNSVILVSGSKQYIVANTVNYEKRSIAPPEVQMAIRSPREAFNENINSNLSLIRHRIKDSSLKTDFCTVGIRTKTSVAVVYLQDVANPKYVTQIKKRLEEIKVDGILESGYIQKFLSNKTTKVFSQIGTIERSDSACAAILEGRVCILVDGSNLALIVPKGAIGFFDAGDDHYANTYIGIFLKFLRITCLCITLTLSSFYVILVAFNPEFLPEKYILVLTSSRVQVPINAFLEAILTELLLELLREANLRTPKQISTSISIVGAIIIGQALVAAGVVSPLIIIISALSSITSYAVVDYTFSSPIRLLKFLMLFLTATFGLFGFVMGLNIAVIKMASTTSFGFPFTAGIAPFNFHDIKNYIWSNVALNKERPKLLEPIDKKRAE